jgi:hypothetical protein
LAEERTKEMSTKNARRTACLMAATLAIALMWASTAWAHSEPYCGHSGRTHDAGVVHRTTFIRHADGYHVTKTEPLEWSGTGYTVTGTWRGKELCRHHLK